MLVLTRGHRKAIVVEDVEIEIDGFFHQDENGEWVKAGYTKPVHVKLGIDAPREVRIMRKEKLARHTPNQEREDYVQIGDDLKVTVLGFCTLDDDGNWEDSDEPLQVRLNITAPDEKEVTCKDGTDRREVAADPDTVGNRAAEPDHGGAGNWKQQRGRRRKHRNSHH